MAALVADAIEDSIGFTGDHPDQACCIGNSHNRSRRRVGMVRGLTTLEILVFAVVIVFVLTAVATLSGMLGLVEFRDPSHLNPLFVALIIELVVVLLAVVPRALRDGRVS